jgi:hypothetical protein
MMSEERVKKYIIELHLVEKEVDKDSKTEDYWEYDEVSVKVEPINDFDNYNEARDLFNDYVKELK